MSMLKHIKSILTSSNFHHPSCDLILNDTTIISKGDGERKIWRKFTDGDGTGMRYRERGTIIDNDTVLTRVHVSFVQLKNVISHVHRGTGIHILVKVLSVIQRTRGESFHHIGNIWSVGGVGVMLTAKSGIVPFLTTNLAMDGEVMLKATASSAIFTTRIVGITMRVAGVSKGSNNRSHGGGWVQWSNKNFITLCLENDINKWRKMSVLDNFVEKAKKVEPSPCKY